MEEIILLRKFILESKRTNAEHIEAIGWVNRLEQAINQYKQEEKARKEQEKSPKVN